jgi:hypothetical protein
MIRSLVFDNTLNSERHCGVILCLLFGRLNADEIFLRNFQQQDPTAHTVHVSTTLLRCVQGQINFKERLAATAAKSYNP